MELRPVEVLQLGPDGSNRVRVKWLSGDYEGMDEWVRFTTLVVPWEQAEAVMAEERALVKLRRHASSVDSHLLDAAQHVLDHLRIHGEVSLGLNSDEGIVRLGTDDLTLERLGISRADLQGYPDAFVDRNGNYVGPWQLGLKVVRAVAQLNRRKLMASLRAERREYRQAAITGWYTSPSGGRDWELPPESAAEHLADVEGLHATIFGWLDAAGQIEEWREIEALRDEVSRLRELIEKTADWLRTKGHTQKAAKLRRDLRNVDADAHS